MGGFPSDESEDRQVKYDGGATCEPHGACALHVLCERCRVCVGHCTCPPPEMRGNDERIAAMKVKGKKNAIARNRRRYGAAA